MVDMLGAIQFNAFYSLLYKGTSLIRKGLPPPRTSKGFEAHDIKDLLKRDGLRLNLGETLPVDFSQL